MNVDYKDQPYYFANATREKAEQILQHSQAGSFIVRPSSQVGNVSISIKESSGNVEHALITYSNNAFHIQLANEDKSGPSVVQLLDSLVPHYLKPNPLLFSEVKAQLEPPPFVAANAKYHRGAASATDLTNQSATATNNLSEQQSQQQQHHTTTLSSQQQHQQQQQQQQQHSQPSQAMIQQPPTNAPPALPVRSSSLGILRSVMARPVSSNKD